MNPFVSFKNVGLCQGGLQVVHLRLRQHGGSMTRPENGITLCAGHADWLLTGRRRARELYDQDTGAFGRWHAEFLYISPSRLSKSIREWRIFLSGISWARTQEAERRR
jgi:hypothetical protein